MGLLGNNGLFGREEKEPMSRPLPDVGHQDPTALRVVPDEVAISGVSLQSQTNIVPIDESVAFQRRAARVTDRWMQQLL